MEKVARKKYTDEFKIEAVKLVSEQGYTQAEAANSLGINAGMLGRWKKEHTQRGKEAFPGNGRVGGLEGEMRKLKEENRRLRMEREILKKATAFFAKESQ